MSSVNKVILIGNLGADPEIRSFQNGDKVANIRIATSERWKDKGTGEQKEKTEWHSIAIFGGLADIAERFLKKGSKVYVEGKLQTRKWQDQSGNDRYTTEVVLNSPRAVMTMLDGAQGGQRGENRDGGAGQGGGGRSGGSGGSGWNESNNGPGRSGWGAGETRGFKDDLDDDIPF